MIDIFSLSVEELASKIKEGHLSSVEVCEKYIERIGKFKAINIAKKYGFTSIENQESQ